MLLFYADASFFGTNRLLYLLNYFWYTYFTLFPQISSYLLIKILYFLKPNFFRPLLVMTF